MNNYNKLIIFLFVLISGFTIAILYLSWPEITGKSYILDVPGPVDPFDPIRGQYTTIRYEINNIRELDFLKEDDKGRDIYVILEKDSNGIYRPKGALFEKPANKDFIKGVIKQVDGKSVKIEYGIEQFFFERGAKFSMINITVEVKVSSSGRASIYKILQNGNPLNITYRERGFL
jgi:uncharacterized membrane-anchored protein